jgi:hypothetical protein
VVALFHSHKTSGDPRAAAVRGEEELSLALGVFALFVTFPAGRLKVSRSAHDPPDHVEGRERQKGNLKRSLRALEPGSDKTVPS